MSRELDRLVADHLAGMPHAARALLGPHIGDAAPDPWIHRALMAYLRYFTRLFERDEDRAVAEALLADELTALTGQERTADDDADITAAEVNLRSGFGQRGFAFLGGRTPPYLGAYIWSRTEERHFSVELPRGEPQEVTVQLMYDFLIRGWLHWQTYGAQGAGGWYQQDEAGWPDGLYAVADRYPEPLDANRSFQVSLLGHEAQHVADHRAFPGLSSVELEYRAKLVELIGYDTVDERLRFFLADAADDPERPHPQAAHRIIERLAQGLFDELPADDGWDALPYEEIRRHAQDLLDEDTERLTASV